MLDDSGGAALTGARRLFESRVYRRALALDPHRVESHHNLGNTLVLLGRHEPWNARGAGTPFDETRSCSPSAKDSTSTRTRSFFFAMAPFANGAIGIVLH